MVFLRLTGVCHRSTVVVYSNNDTAIYTAVLLSLHCVQIVHAMTDEGGHDRQSPALWRLGHAGVFSMSYSVHTYIQQHIPEPKEQLQTLTLIYEVHTTISYTCTSYIYIYVG